MNNKLPGWIVLVTIVLVGLVTVLTLETPWVLLWIGLGLAFLSSLKKT